MHENAILTEKIFFLLLPLPAAKSTKENRKEMRKDRRKFEGIG